MSLTTRNLTVLRGECPVVDHVSLSVGAGEFVGLIGPNGAGKTTFMRAALGLMKSSGESTIAALPLSARARAAAWMPQQREIAWALSVEDVIHLGRTAHGGIDRSATNRAIERMGLTNYRSRTATELSGGEQARVLIARALAQETPLLMADEPIAGLDPSAQIATMQVFADLAAEGKTVIASLHDLGLAARHCTRIVMLGRGRVVADGPPREVLTDTNLRDVFRLRAYYADTGDGPVFQPLEVL